MKTCRTCGKTYDDDTMVYCLDDGARLVDAEAKPDADATLNLPLSPTIHAEQARAKSPPTAANPQATITARHEHFQMPHSPGAVTNETNLASRRSALPWIFAIVLVLGISGVVTAWLLTRGGNDRARSETGEPTPFATPRASPEASAEVVATPRIHRPEPTPKQAFEVLDNMTFNGSRITYYPRETFAQCQADCSGNADCRGFTWVRPGGYNKGDSAMCYLMSAVTGNVGHTCCISGVRN